SRKDYLRLFNIVDEALGDNTEIRERVADELMKASKEQFKEAKHRRLQSMGLVSLAFVVAAIAAAVAHARSPVARALLPVRTVGDTSRAVVGSPDPTTQSTARFPQSLEILGHANGAVGRSLPPRLRSDDKRALESLFALVRLALDFDLPLEGCRAILTTT